MRCGYPVLAGRPGTCFHTCAGVACGAGNFEGTALEYKLQNTKMVRGGTLGLGARSRACAHGGKRAVSHPQRVAVPLAASVSWGGTVQLTAVSQHEAGQLSAAPVPASKQAQQPVHC